MEIRFYQFPQSSMVERFILEFLQLEIKDVQDFHLIEIRSERGFPQLDKVVSIYNFIKLSTREHQNLFLETHLLKLTAKLFL